jgi:ribosomal protein S18 acetylase RimI-like enzyme
VIVERARREEWTVACDLILAPHGGAARPEQIKTALFLLDRGDVTADGLFVARHDGIEGAILCQAAPGDCGIVWPPRAVTNEINVEDVLLRHGLSWLRSRGCRLAQSFLTPDEQPLAAPFVRNDMPHVTDLWYFRHDLHSPLTDLNDVDRLTYLPYGHDTAQLFEETLTRSYQGTLDCPEINGVRSAASVLEGHRSEGVFDPQRWLLAQHGPETVGLILLTEMRDAEAWDVAYVGVVPEARRHGWAREMMRHAVRMAHEARVGRITLCVDGRNHPAWNLYIDLGFRAVEKRHVYLAVWR